MITFERAKKAVSTLHKRGWWVDATKEDLDFIAKKTS